MRRLCCGFTHTPEAGADGSTPAPHHRATSVGMHNEAIVKHGVAWQQVGEVLSRAGMWRVRRSGTRLGAGVALLCDRERCCDEVPQHRDQPDRPAAMLE